jgi:hypothetical protein
MLLAPNFIGKEPNVLAALAFSQIHNNNSEIPLKFVT